MYAPSEGGNDVLVIGMDVGSTTVKAVVVEPRTRQILWHRYQRHHTKQPEKVLELLEAILGEFGDSQSRRYRLFLTGSGSGPLEAATGGKFVQEVNAVTLAVEERHPDVQSVIELGGQDAKIIFFKLDPASGDRTAHASMNDKCASGTGATIDKCLLKVGVDPAYAGSLRFDASRLHHVAAKCGVFAETDIVNLVKAGIPANEVLCSLADAIVMQNLSVLTRGSTLRANVLLLGGPNCYLPFLRDCWRHRIPETWRERGYVPDGKLSPEELIRVPERSELYAALGAALFGLSAGQQEGRFEGLEGLRRFIEHGRRANLGEHAGPPLVTTADEAADFARAYAIPRFEPARFRPGQEVRGFVGLDGGSTSSKAVLISEEGELLVKTYQLSKGNPIEDAKELFAKLEQCVVDQGATLTCLGFGATGYAADVLEQCMLADVNVVETVAHMVSAVHYFGDVDVVCDIGGQDIKVLFLKNGDIQNFKLSNSCSAGNGMLLQAMADQFGLPLNKYADAAFQAELSPKFSYGCAVFLDTDRVNFQKEGFQRDELLSGLAQVLPKNVWQYVVQVPRMAALGRRFVLQGGTQYNLAALKAQVDYIKQRVPDAEVLVHPHTGEAGAIGAAMETMRRIKRTGKSRFIGIDAARNLSFVTRNDESTVCHFCPNECRRTFIDASRPDGSLARYISGFSCEKGTVESEATMLELVKERKKTAALFPNLVEYEGRKAFQHFYQVEPLPSAEQSVEDVRFEKRLLRTRRVTYTRRFARSSEQALQRRRGIRIGIPRVLNVYMVAPFLRTYFEALGVPKTHVVFSEPTSAEMWLAGGKYGSTDPCFPSKVAQAHIHHLLFEAHQPNKQRGLNYIFFPILTHVMNFVAGTVDDASCPIVAGTPDVIRAAFTKETDFFAERGIEYVAPALTFAERHLLARRMFETWGGRLDVTEDESDFACEQAWKALQAFNADMEEKGRAILDTVEAEHRIAILVIGRPYHLDPGLNHGIPEEFQSLGYPILSIRSIPKSREYLDRFFADELSQGVIRSPLEISHIWPENYSANSAQKVWAANFAAHHPNVAVLDLSSFKCGHDAPTYAMIDAVLQATRTPSAALHDLDANKPGGSIKIRVKTYAHSLSLERERLEDVAAKSRELAWSLGSKRLALLEARQNELKYLERRDEQLEHEIAHLRELVASYTIQSNPESCEPGQLIQLRRKLKTQPVATAPAQQTVPLAAE